MISLKLPELQLVDVPLQADLRAVKGIRDAPHDRIEGRLSVGMPTSFLINTDVIGDDSELKGFLAVRSKDYAFFLTSLACTFQPGEGEPFHRAWLKVQMARVGQEGMEGQPVAWSMTPTRLEEGAETPKTIEIGAELKFESISVKPTVNMPVPQGQKEIFIQAFNNRQSNPYWEFAKTSKSPLAGSYRLAVIVQTTVGSNTHCSINVLATIERKKFGIITYRADFPGTATAEFDLP